ncbi:MAG: SMC-Scp complex subunit ScpB [Leptolyngbyaceae cyanobacterium RM2_2_4]|nr:SMC-Scp complex subunit ScpB [Leptolyngbyaceae cyanobacterium RM2_2_4]
MSLLASKIEAILYLKGQPLSIAQIAEYAGCDKDAAEEGLIELMADYAHRDSALEIAETNFLPITVKDPLFWGSIFLGQIDRWCNFSCKNEDWDIVHDVLFLFEQC